MKCFNIPIFVPHYGCPHQCVFCDQKTITGSGRTVDGAYAAEQIQVYLETLPGKGVRIEAAFFGGSFTGICPTLRRELLEAVQHFLKSGQIHGIRLSTRPDYIDREVLEELLHYGVTTIELGVQSMDEAVLAASERGHGREAVYTAVSLIRRYPFSLGLQMMTGLPQDTPERSIKTAEELIAQKPNFVRIYPTMVLADTPLAKLWKQGRYRPQSLEEAVELCAKLYAAFSAHNIPVIRMGLPETPGTLAGPWHPAFGELVESACYLEQFSELLVANPSRKPHFFVAERELSKAIGIRKKNLSTLRELTGEAAVIRGSKCCKKGEIRWIPEKESEAEKCI